MDEKAWLSLMIGNSRLHWAVLTRDQVMEAWNTNHLARVTEAPANIEDGFAADLTDEGEGIPLSFLSATAQSMLRDEGSTLIATGPVAEKSETNQPTAPIGVDDAAACLRLDPDRFRVASVVPNELELWLHRCPGIRAITSQDALVGVYATLGVDRALAVRGAARVSGWPVMVVDCGSALTFTAGDRQGRLGGGAILPGVRLQLAALGTRTAQLPSDVKLPERLPPRWAMNTAGSIQAGVMWTIVAGIQSFIKDRWRMEPDAAVVFTGGDGEVFHKAVVNSWGAEDPDNLGNVQDRLKYVEEVIHLGIASLAFETSQR